MKHINTKHKEKKNKSGEVEINESNIVSECSMCEDTFSTKTEYTKHVDKNLDEIQNIDIDYLKNGHEIFECNNCQFTSNDPEVIKIILVSMS